MSEEPEDERRLVEASQLREAWRRRFGSNTEHRRLLAERFEVSKAFVGHLFSGTKPISATWKLRIAHFMDVDARSIWPGFDPVEALREHLPPHLAELLRAAAEADPEIVKAAQALLEAAATRKGGAN